MQPGVPHVHWPSHGHGHYRLSFRRATWATGLGEDRTPHELRHSCMSLISASAVADTVLANRGGHTDTRWLREAHRHQVTPMVTGAVAAAEALFGGKSDTPAA